MTKKQEMQAVIRHYKEVTGKKEIEMAEVVNFAVDKLGWPLPQPKGPREILAKDFSDAAREQTKRDGKTGHPYRVNHAITNGKGLPTSWFDIDESPPRKRMEKSLVQRREQMVGDALQLTFDQDHWNRVNPNEQAIELPLDFGPDVEWAKNSFGDQKAG